MKMPKGYPVAGGKIKIAIKIDCDLFKDLLAKAESDKVTFSTLAQDALKCGLLCLNESDALEPKP